VIEPMENFKRRLYDAVEADPALNSRCLELYGVLPVVRRNPDDRLPEAVDAGQPVVLSISYLGAEDTGAAEGLAAMPLGFALGCAVHDDTVVRRALEVHVATRDTAGDTHVKEVADELGEAREAELRELALQALVRAAHELAGADVDLVGEALFVRRPVWAGLYTVIITPNNNWTT